VAYVHDGLHRTALERGRVQLHHLRARSNHDPRIAYELWRLIARLQPDIVQTWLPQMDIIGGSVALLRRVPWILSERSSADAYTAHFRDRIVRRKLGRWADGVVANSRAGCSLWRDSIRGSAGAQVIRNAVDVEAIAASEPASLERFGVASKRPALIFVGRLSPEKNLPLLLKVADRVCRQTPVTLLICGDGPRRGEVEAWVSAAGARDRILILGQQDDIWRLMKASKAFISTSTFEGQPNAVLEAMACRCPLVVSDIPSHREFLDAGTADFASTEEDFVNAILRALENTPDVKARVDTASDQVLQYGSRAAALAYEMVYNRASAGR
jgi:glycosyltransferase involved in cell wall biosynthesis